MIIVYQKLAELTGFKSYESLANGKNCLQTEWTKSIDVGSKSFVEAIKEKLGILAQGRKIIEKEGKLQLREEMEPIMLFLIVKKKI